MLSVFTDNRKKKKTAETIFVKSVNIKYSELLFCINDDYTTDFKDFLVVSDRKITHKQIRIKTEFKDVD